MSTRAVPPIEPGTGPQLAELSQSVQDYLREIYNLERDNGRVTTTVLAGRLGVAAASATTMLKRLASLGLVEHTRYRGARLTPAGERFAIELVRHHRLLESYLLEHLGLDLEDVHAEADRLEHGLSEAVEARIDEALGFPTRDPHGDPIPSVDLEVPPDPPRRPD